MEVAVESQPAALDRQPSSYVSPPSPPAAPHPPPHHQSPEPLSEQEQEQREPSLQDALASQAASPPPAQSALMSDTTTETESSAPDRPAVAEVPSPSVPSQTTEQTDGSQSAETVVEPLPVLTYQEPEGVVLNGEPDLMETDDPTARGTAANGGESTAEQDNSQPQPAGTPTESTTAESQTRNSQRARHRDGEGSPDESSPSTASDGSTDSSESTERTGDDYGDEEDENEEHAYWAEYKEDTSMAEGDELKEIESGDADHSALEYDYIEKAFYHELDDPEYKPTEKARITWKITGIRGTKDKPNRATILRSPPAYIGGYYWTIKFFPRGNSVGSLSVYLECSTTPPEQDKVVLETEFKVVKGPFDADPSDLTPVQEIKFPATVVPPKPTPSDSTEKGQDKTRQRDQEADQEELPDASNENKAEPESSEKRPKSKPDFRVSAQIGVVLYNPQEPRTAWTQSSCHQFNSHNFDWGWTHFHGPGPWNTIHLRQHGQRQALLRNDTLCFDAYIRLFEDPTRSLWWHSSETEPVWDSRSLVGLKPMGDTSVSYCEHTAGLVPWLLLSPFRDLVKSVDAMRHISDAAAIPRPVCEALQYVVHQMTAEKDVTVWTETVRRSLRYMLEDSGDVIKFWERLRRSMEIELAGTDAVEKLAYLFDSPHDESEMSDEQLNLLPRSYNSHIRITSESAESIQSGVTEYLKTQPGRWSLPPVLHIELNRQRFDKKSRQWKFLTNRVRRNEELDLSDYVDSRVSGKYTLFSFIVHKGQRNSRWYYPVVRPGGPNTHWLAFKGENPFRIECLTNKTATEGFEGSEGSEAAGPDPVGQNDLEVAVAFIYIRNDVQAEFLSPKLEPWTAPQGWSRYIERASQDVPKFCPEKCVQVHFYGLNGVSESTRNPADAYDLVQPLLNDKSTVTLDVPMKTTVMELRAKLVEHISTEEAPITNEQVRLWTVGVPHETRPFSFSMMPLQSLHSQVLGYGWGTLRVWVQILKGDDLIRFSIPDIVPAPPEPENMDDMNIDVQESQGQTEGQPQTDEQVQNSTQDEDVEMDDASPEVAENTASQNQEDLIQISENPAPEVVEREMTDDVETVDHQETNGVEHLPAPNVNLEDEAANEAMIASIIAHDLALLDNTHEMDTSETYQETNRAPPPPPPPPPMDDVTTGAGGVLIRAQETEMETERENQEQSGSEDSPMEGSPIVESNNVAPVATLNGETDQPDHQGEQEQPRRRATTTGAVAPVELPDQVLCFVQEFDAEKQTIKTIGAYIMVSNHLVREGIRERLKLTEEQGYNFWSRRKAVASMYAVSNTHMFRDLMNEVGCIIIGKTIPKRRQNELTEAGCFISPDRLLEYQWALHRKDPIKAFTGKVTVEAMLNGEYYSGDLVKGFSHGKGTHISETSDTYTGGFIQGRRQGTGTMEYSSGDTYTGDWYEDQPHGQGTWLEGKTGNKYIGGFRNGKRHGKGISYWEVADEQLSLCQICYLEEQDSLFYTCGHVCACNACANQVEICPVCREKVVTVVKIFKC